MHVQAGTNHAIFGFAARQTGIYQHPFILVTNIVAISVASRIEQKDDQTHTVGKKLLFWATYTIVQKQNVSQNISNQPITEICQSVILIDIAQESKD